MTQTSLERPTPRSLPLVADPPTPAVGAGDDAELAESLRAYRAAEEERLGLKRARRQWVDEMIDPHFSKAERPRVTLLISGLTAAQDFLVEGALRGRGYRVENIGCPDTAALQVGKEYGNRAQCNPTYFTVGNLVKHLIWLRDERGLSSEQIVADYLFLTAGACGPCRFGMYVTEYRKALRDAGFDGFRVMLFQQQGGLDQATGDEAGLELNPDFFVGILQAIVCGDVLNAIGYRIRPYEARTGSTDEALEEAKRLVYTALAERKNVLFALFKSRKLFEAIEIDPLRPRPKVCIIGEFWAMTTEGDGNYQLQRFLESEGAEVDIQLTTAWLLYNIWEVARDTRVRAELREADGGQMGLAEHQGPFDVAKRLATMKAAEAALRIAFQIFARPPGLGDYHLPDMDQVAEVAHEHYANDLRGGEGHMEVGKLILNVVKSKAHMTLSVKPFGCMPSSAVSDGVQSLITSRWPGSIFCAVETSGDGATNFYSRVQMYLYKARLAAEDELRRAYEECGVTEKQVRGFLRDNPHYASALHHSPHVVAGAAANLVHEVAPLILKSRAQRLADGLRGQGRRAVAALRQAPLAARAVRSRLADPDLRQALLVDLELASDLLRGKLPDRFRPLAERLANRAFQGEDVEPLAAE